MVKNRVIVLSLCMLAVVGSITAAAEADGLCEAAAAGGSCEAIDADAAAPADCVDEHPRCGEWADAGECENNPGYMLHHCPVACDSCPDPVDLAADDRALLAAVAAYGKPQKIEGASADATMEVVRGTVAYMRDDVHGTNPTHALSPDIVAECVNREELCAFWAVIGECEANKAYMKLKCAPSCQTCHMIDINARCPPLGDDVRPGLLPGELNAMFERILATAPGNRTDGAPELGKGMTNYSVRVHSRPPPREEGEPPVVSKERDLAEPPWIVTFEDFLTAEECAHLIQLGYQSEYKRSEDVGAVLADGSYDSIKSVGRTSENAWCSYAKGCRNDTLVAGVHARMAMVTGIPGNHSEDLQMLKYEPGQFYRQHHDYIGHQRDRRSGPRVLTFFLYLSDVEEGGATNFPLLDIAVRPKMGRAVLWPSVLDSNPKDKEPRTDHEAQNVVAGLKFGANAWVHLHDYVAAQDMACT